MLANNINGFTYEELFSLAIQKPIMAQLEITKNCNQCCFFCFRHCNSEQKFVDKSLAEWKMIIKKLVNIGVRELNFSGGEIFLFKNVDKLFKHSKLCGIEKIVVNTNGLVDLTKHDLSNIDTLVFSVHEIDKMHDQIVGTPNSFEILNKAIKDAINRKCRIGINTVVVSQNIKALKNTYDYFKDLNLNFHAFNLYIDCENFSEKVQEYKNIFPQYLKFLKTVPKKRRKLRHGMHNIFIKDKNFFQSTIPLPHCAAGKYKLVVDYKGDIYPCRYFQTKKYFCGNAIEGNLAEIWKNGKGFKYFRDIILKDKLPSQCQSCFKKDKCKGGCLAWRIYNKKLKCYEKDIRCEFGNAYIRS